MSPDVRGSGIRRLLPIVGMAVAVAMGCSSGGDGQPLTSPSSSAPLPQEQVRDDVAGVAYDIPNGWTEYRPEDLLDFFTSAVASASPEEADSPDFDASTPVGLVGAGLFTSTFYDPAQDGLRDAAVSGAQGFAEFFIPTSEHAPVRHDAATTVDGLAAWRADYSVSPDDPDAAPSTVVLIAIDAPTPVYLIAAISGESEDIQEVVETVLASATVIPANATKSTSSQ